MKLTLKAQNGVAILSGTGDIHPHDIEILRAGFTKLLQSGRNRIVFEIPDSEKIPGELIREISKFDMLARELSGRIVLAGTESLCARVAQFARPPVIQSYAGVEKALQGLKAGETLPDQATPAPAAAAPAPSGDEQAKCKADIRQKELTDLTSLRKRISQLENENRLLMNQLLSQVPAAPAPQAETAQTAMLNARIEELLQQIKK